MSTVQEVSIWSRILHRIKHPFTVPASIITLTRNVSEKEQMVGNFYVKSIDELEHLEAGWRVVVQRMEAGFKAELEKAKAAMDAELAAKNKKEGK